MEFVTIMFAFSILTTLTLLAFRLRAEKREPIKTTPNPFSVLDDETTSQEPPSPTFCQPHEPKKCHTDHARYFSQAPDSSFPPPSLPTTPPTKDNFKISSETKTKKPKTKPKTKPHPTTHTKTQTIAPSKTDSPCSCCTVSIAITLIIILLIWIILLI